MSWGAPVWAGEAPNKAIRAEASADAGEVRPSPKPGMVFEYNRGIEMSDGLALRANVFRPSGKGRYPVIITHGPYGKDVAWQTGEPYRAAWDKVKAKVPDICKASSCSFMRWETPDPERWVPSGYVVIHADSRGSGKTAGLLDILGARETQDYKELIEWAAQQPWSNGKVGLLGISYYAINQWQVASLQPKGLAAIIPWEGALDAYRDISYHGGIPSTMFTRNWTLRQVFPNQHGNGATPFRDAVTGESAVGPALPPTVLAASRRTILDDVLAHPFNGAYHVQRSGDPSRIHIPVLSVGNWAGGGLHLRGNIEGFTQAATSNKWLRMHTGDHFSPFYRDTSLQLQKAFFDRFLKGDPKAFRQEPRVVVTVRDPVGGDRLRAENAWPLEGTRFERWYLQADGQGLAKEQPGTVAKADYEARSEGVTFRLPASTEAREFTGPLMARLWVSSSTTDADLYLTVRLLDPSGRDVTFEGSNAPAVPVAQGWLRLSHRELDVAASTPGRPVHPHRVPMAVEPGKPYAADVEIWPTSIVVPAGHTLALTVGGQDFAFPHLTSGVYRGSAPFMHDGSDPKVFGGRQTLYTGGDYDSYLLLPAIPADRPVATAIPAKR
ncbi:MAG: CocE/NonD family hydrolase [Aquabacterium sp.]|uniref:CocE/NonD family hydrolase n=1 Tax=Aquabacterium sp. TaxID=1872578 RepID=UPI003BB0505E